MVTTTLAEQILEELEQADTLEKLYQVMYRMRDGYRVKHISVHLGRAGSVEDVQAQGSNNHIR